MFVLFILIEITVTSSRAREPVKIISPAVLCCSFIAIILFKLEAIALFKSNDITQTFGDNLNLNTVLRILQTISIYNYFLLIKTSLKVIFKKNGRFGNMNPGTALDG